MFRILVLPSFAVVNCHVELKASKSTITTTKVDICIAIDEINGEYVPKEGYGLYDYECD